MKVLLVATVQSHICQFHKPLVAMLHEHGCEVHVAARNNLAEKNGLKLDFVEQVFDVPFDRSPFSARNLKAYRQLQEILAAEAYDVVHCNTPVGGVIGRLAARDARKHGAQVFYTAHGFHFYQGAPKKNWLLWYPVEKYMCRYTDKLITINEEDARLARRHFQTQVFHIHGVGVSTKRYYEHSQEEMLAMREQEGLGETDYVVLCTGELNENKDQKTLIRAAALVHEQLPDLRVLLAGNGPKEAELKRLILDMNAGSYVHMLGYRTDLERYANIADVIVSCSYREGLPMNIVEGMLLGKPVVASYNRGHRELIVPDVTGYMVPPADANAFAEKIAVLLNDGELADRMGQAGYEKAQLYADTNVRQELQAIYGL